MEDDDALSVWSNEGEERRMTPSFMKDEAVLSELGSVLLDQRSKSHKKMYTEEYLEGQRRTRDNGEEAKLLPLLGENGPEDKWVFECKNTVVSAAISGNCCAWASNDNLIHFASFDKIQKSFKKYDDSIHKVLVTKGMVESLDFSLQNDWSFVAQEIELAVVDFEGWLYIFSFKLEQMVDPSTWTCERRVKHKVKGHASLSCVSMWRGKENSSAYIVVGSSKNPELLIFELKRTSKGAAGLICNGVIQLKGNPLDTQIIPLTKPPKDFDLGYLFCVAVADDSGELNVMEISQQQLLETSTEERLVQTAFSIRLEFTGVELGDMLSASDPDPESDPNPESWNENTKFRIAVACSDLSVYVIEQVYLMPAPKKELRRTSKWRNTPGVSSATDLDAVVALNSWEPIARFEVPAMVLSASISQDGRRVAAAHEGRQVCVYQVDAGCLSHVYECGGGAGARVRCVALGNQHLLMGSFGHAATIVDIHRGLEERLRVRKSRRAQGVTAVALAPAGDLLAVGSRSGRCWVYRVAPDEDPRELYAPAMGNLVHDMVFSDDGEFLAIGDYNGSVDVLVAKDGHSAVSDESRHQFFQCISSDDTGSQKFIWGLSFKSKSIVELGQEDRGGTQLSKEYILAVACWDGVAHVFILISNHHCHQTSHLTVQELAKIRETGHGSEVEVDSRAYDVSLSNGGRHLVVAWRSGVVRLYDLQAKPEPEQVCDLIKLENREIVSQLIDYMVEQESVLAIDPYFLESFLPALCKGNVYNQVMRKKLQKEGMTDDEFEKYKQIDSFLKGYISQKVKKKNRETVQDLLSSAAAGPEELDLKMGAAAEQGKLDASCLSYVRELVRGEEAKAAGRSAGDPALLLRVLRLLQDRIEAELRMADRPEVRALSHLVRIPDEADREAAVRKSFTNRDGFLRFRDFLRDGMEYFLNKGAGTLAVSNRLPQDSVERMNHILNVVNDILKREYGGV